MATAQFEGIDADQHVSLQDAGRGRHLRYRIPASRPMDHFAFTIANLALGNPANSTAIEASRGGLALLCTAGQISFAVTGGSFQVAGGGQPLAPWCIAMVCAGDVLTIRPGRWRCGCPAPC